MDPKRIEEQTMESLCDQINLLAFQRSELRLRIKNLEAELKAEREWAAQAAATVILGSIVLFVLIIYSMFT